MKKYYCDATGEEIVNGNYKTLDMPIHIIEMVEGKTPSYTDNKGNPTSTTIERFEVSLEAYNRIMVVAYFEFLKIKEESKQEQEMINKIKNNFLTTKQNNNQLIQPSIIAKYGINFKPPVVLSYGVSPNLKNNDYVTPSKMREMMSKATNTINDFLDNKIIDKSNE